MCYILFINIEVKQGPLPINDYMDYKYNEIFYMNISKLNQETTRPFYFEHIT